MEVSNSAKKQNVELPTWSREDVTLEDLAKLPLGPREVLLLNYPTTEIIRLSYQKELDTSIKVLLESPGFWVKLLTRDGFILPKDILEFAEKWRKKHKTAAQFLRSLYKIGLNTFRLDSLFFCLTDELKNFEKLKCRTAETEKIRELLKLVEANRLEILTLDETITALTFSSSVYHQRNSPKKTFTFRINVEIDDLESQFDTLTEFLNKLRNLPVVIGYSDDFIPDPLGIIHGLCLQEREKEAAKLKAKRKQDKHQAQIKSTSLDIIRSRSYSPASSSITITDPGNGEALRKYHHYLDLILKLAKEGDTIQLDSHTERYFIFQRDGITYIKQFINALPEEALPFLCQQGYTTLQAIRREYTIDQIEFQDRLISLSDNVNRTLTIKINGIDCTFSVKPPLQRFNKCRWLGCSKLALLGTAAASGYFCSQHEDESDDKEYFGQRDRCHVEDERGPKFEDFPLIWKNEKQNSRQ